ncbi:T9SS type A sorting domain-containing protein [Hymenobacter antarcticus]|uniref:Por secretion system C-terminal sorting domain-containing protein n=1 Tax=Hymenobacter antarcticus TaxID=486270 RepID=A0ABP7QKM9_9BACT
MQVHLTDSERRALRQLQKQRRDEDGSVTVNSPTSLTAVVPTGAASGSSADGQKFTALGIVAAAGSSSSARRYGFVDSKLPGAALLYYRLKQVDVDGTFAYSPVRAVTVNRVAGLALFPNPARTGATLTGAQPGAVVTVFDALGRLVTSAPADAGGTAALVLPAGLPAGVYVVWAGNKALRLVVE